MMRIFLFIVTMSVLQTNCLNAQSTYSLQYAKAIENEVVSFVQEDSYILHGSKDLFYYRDNQIIILDLSTFTETVFATIGTSISTDIMQIYRR